jgi:hypothetical protein
LAQRAGQQAAERLRDLGAGSYLPG